MDNPTLISRKQSYGRSFESWRQACLSAIGSSSLLSGSVDRLRESVGSSSSSALSNPSRNTSECAPCSNIFASAVRGRRRYPIRSALESANATRASDKPIDYESSEDFADLGRPETEEERKRREACEQWTEDIFKTSPMIRFMAKHLAIVGCDPLADTPRDIEPRILIRTCPGDPIMEPDKCSAGGFGPGPYPDSPPDEGGIIICSNFVGSKKHLEDTFAHEMIHWWDHCRFKVDWENLRHHACSEIRAANLSGDCSMRREWERREFGFSKQHQACVRRRAILSVRMNPMCKDEAMAAQAVDDVWQSCFADTRPFDEIY